MTQKLLNSLQTTVKLLLSFLLLALWSEQASAWDYETVKRIESATALPQLPDREVVVTRYGANPKASAAKNQKAINRAIAEMSKSGGGRVVIPAGTWRTGALHLLSHVNLVISKDATLSFVFNTKLYPLVKTSWEGLECWNYSPCIYAREATDIAITGEGTIDGGGSNVTWWAMCGKERFGYKAGVTKEAQSLGSRDRLQKMAEDGVDPDKRRFGRGQGLRPQLINVMHCERVLIKGVRLINSPFWVIHPLLSKSITVDDVKIWNEGPNGDGCDPEACENVIIKNCSFHTGDDCIAIKSGRNNDGRLWQRPARNIIIRNCKMEDGHGAVVIGSEISGGCQNVFAEDCMMDSPNLERVLRIKTNNCRGGIIENINMRNIKVGQCSEAVLKINLDYERQESCYRGFNPLVRNVTMENVTCDKCDYGILVIGLDTTVNVQDIIVRNCRFNGVRKKPVSVTGMTRNMVYDNLCINGNLVKNDAANPYTSYAEWMTYSEIQRNPQPWLLDFAKKPKWNYAVGIELEGMLDTYLHHGGDTIQKYLEAYLRHMVTGDGKVIGYEEKDYHLDNVRPAKLVERMQQLDKANRSTIASAAARQGRDQALQVFFDQLNKQPRTTDGVYWHKAIYARQVWLDGIFMGLPFRCLYAKNHLSPRQARKVYDDAVKQIMTTDRRTFDATTGLWKHAWDETHSVFWADKTTGQSRHTWARALGWYAMAITEVLDVLPENYAHRAELQQLLQKVMTAVVKYQDEKSGVWYDVMDVNDTHNYLESTASCMFAYVLLKGVCTGNLPKSDNMGGTKVNYLAAGIKAYEGILRNFIRVNDDKTISLTHCCAVSGLGPGPGPLVKKPNYKRDGSFEYYISEPIRDNDAKGVGPFIWASLEMESLHESQKTAGYYIAKPGVAQSVLDIFHTIASSENKSQRVKIFLPNGVYDFGNMTEQTFPVDSLSIIGQSMDSTILVTRPKTEQEGLGLADMFLNTRSGLYLQDLTLNNALEYYEAGRAGRAAVMQDAGNHTIYNKVRMLSHQDTYYSSNTAMEAYFRDCDIHGTVDFICGGGDIRFDNTTLSLEPRNADGTGRRIITAPSTTTPFGYVFDHCRIVDLSQGQGSWCYGRTWRNQPVSVFLHTVLDDHAASTILPERWIERGMNATNPYVFGEYLTLSANGTTLSPVSHSINSYDGPHSTILSDNQAAGFSYERMFPRWNPKALTKDLTVSELLLYQNKLSWEATPQATAYAVFHNNVLQTITTATSYSATHATGKWAVRAANCMGGFGPETVTNGGNSSF